ncbi:HAD family hydrolase [uncultured Ruminococcus sp.]|uniref:HAD family hydrolase n=1 Tax=uncultured Ruminococcus sp. TaxID=165186 RepID=UPI0025DB3F78|nr:HAD hydrolase-like protein [uncultured Ruminococcus sp.]
MKKLIIFDLDGTLLDTSEGIMHCYRKTGAILNLQENTIENKKCVIGGPLKDGFQCLYKIDSENQLEKAIATYRSIYQSEGIKMFCAYDGIEELLKNLKENGYLLAVATLKAESYAKQMLESAGFAKYFDVIHGWDGTDRCTKAYIITKVIFTLNMISSEAILVGDSEYDAYGADAADVDFLGVSYGFGIRKCESKSKLFPIADSPEDVLDYIINFACD